MGTIYALDISKEKIKLKKKSFHFPGHPSVTPFKWIVVIAGKSMSPSNSGYC